MEKPIIWMFAGQGTQFYQMGKELFEKDPVFRQVMERGDRVVAELINESLVDIIYRPRQNRFEPFRRLLHSHPAILLFECALADSLTSRGLRPDALLGYSLGELACQVVAGTLPLEEALTTAIRLAEMIEYAAPRGMMLAILEAPDFAARHPAEFQDFAIAARNFKSNFIVSGPAEPGQRLQRFLQNQGVSFVELPVDYPLHSPLMEVCQTPCRTLISQLSFAAPRIPIISSTAAATGSQSENVWNAMQKPMDLAGKITSLLESGGGRFVDLSPAGSMATAVKYNLPAGSTSEYYTLASPFGQECSNIEKMLGKLNAA